MRLKGIPTEFQRRALLAVVVVSSALCFALVAIRWFPTEAALRNDSSIFAYGGLEILHGRLPYRDFWDHKPPLVYPINALAILLFGAPPAGLWAFDMLWGLLVLVLLFKLGKAMFGAVPSLVGTILVFGVLFHPDYYQDGNFTEFYALVPQLLVLHIAFRYASARDRRSLFLVGVLGGICFLTKQTAVGTAVATALVILASGLRQGGVKALALNVATMAIGALVPLGLAASIWLGLGAWSDLWEATWEFNVLYSSAGSIPKAILATLRSLALEQPLASVAALGLGGMALEVAERQKRRLTKISPEGQGGLKPQEKTASEAHGFVVTCVMVSVGVEVILASLSGRGYAHYYIPLIPALGLLAMRLMHSFHQEITNSVRVGSWTGASLGLAMAAILAWSLESYAGLRPKALQLSSLMEWIATRRLETPTEIAYVAANTDPDETVLVWGRSAGINVLANRGAPSRYVYGSPLVASGYGDTERWHEFIQDLKQSPPALILDTPNQPSFVSFNPTGPFCRGCSEEVREGMLLLKDFVADNYEIAVEISGFRIYRRLSYGETGDG